MKNSFRLLITFSFAIISCFFCGTIVKAEQRDNSVQVMSDVLKEKIKQEEYDSLYSQLEQQNGLSLYDAFKEIINAELDHEFSRQEFNGKFSYTVLSSTSAPHYNGVVIKYDQPYKGVKDNSVITTYMNKSCTYKYLISAIEPNIYESIIEEVTKIRPLLNGSFKIISWMRIAVVATAIAKINDAGGYGKIIAMYNDDLGSPFYFVYAWSTYPYITIPENAVNVTIVK